MNQDILMRSLHSNDNLQEKVVFVTCEDDDKVAEMQKLTGKYVRLCFCVVFISRFLVNINVLQFMLSDALNSFIYLFFLSLHLWNLSGWKHP